ASSRWFRWNLWLHRWTSLIATLPFLVLCLTGTVLIFHEELDALLGVVPESEHDRDVSHRPLQASVTNVLEAFPGERVMSIGIDPEDHPGVLLVVTGPREARDFDDAKLRFADLVTAEPVGDPEAKQSITGFLLELHAQWFLGPAGELLGAL